MEGPPLCTHCGTTKRVMMRCHHAVCLCYLNRDNRCVLCLREEPDPLHSDINRNFFFSLQGESACYTCQHTRRIMSCGHAVCICSLMHDNFRYYGCAVCREQRLAIMREFQISSSNKQMRMSEATVLSSGGGNRRHSFGDAEAEAEESRRHTFWSQQQQRQHQRLQQPLTPPTPTATLTPSLQQQHLQHHQLEQPPTPPTPKPQQDNAAAPPKEDDDSLLNEALEMFEGQDNFEDFED